MNSIIVEKYGTPEGTFLFRHLSEDKLKQEIQNGNQNNKIQNGTQNNKYPVSLTGNGVKTIYDGMQIKTRKTDKKFKQQTCLLNDLSSFLSNIYENRNQNEKDRKEIKTTKISF